jgi:transcriptional regulator with XRE-family HTH domain
MHDSCDLTDKLFSDFFDDNEDIKNELEKLEAFASFINDCDFLKGVNKLTQHEIAKKMKTSQSSISRLNKMKGNPSYSLLRKYSEAIGGKLFLSPLDEMTVTLPYDLHEHAKQWSEDIGLSVKDLIIKTFRDAFEETVTNAVAETATEHLSDDYSNTSEQNDLKCIFDNGKRKDYIKVCSEHDSSNVNVESDANNDFLLTA